MDWEFPVRIPNLDLVSWESLRTHCEFLFIYIYFEGSTIYQCIPPSGMPIKNFFPLYIQIVPNKPHSIIDF